MEDNKNFVEETTENVEVATTEEIATEQVETIPEKTFTQSELNEIVKGAKARAKAQVRKEYDRKYGNLTNVLRAGTGKESVEEMTNTFADFYEKKGIKINREPDYTAKDIEVLATAEANEVIRLGYDEVVDEVDRLASLGVNNMTAKEKALFKVLAEHRQNTERHNELAKIGVTEDVYNSDEFQNFAKQFNSTTPIADIWNIYNKTQPKKDIKPMGSMKNTNVNEIKDFYSAEEISRLTEDDLRNPDVWTAVRRSMTGTK
jgi:hypothetical protein